MNETRVCIRCRGLIDPTDYSRAIFAAKQEKVSGFSVSGTTEYADGGKGWLHSRCFSVPAYRQLPAPD